MIKLKNILQEAGLLSEQTAIDTIEFTFDNNEYSFRADQQEQLNKVIARVKSAQATGGKVKKITIDSSESQVPSTEFEPEELATKRAKTLQAMLQAKLPNISIEINPKIGSEKYTSGVDNSKHSKYDKDRYVRAKIEIETKSKEIVPDYSQYIKTYTTAGNWVADSDATIQRHIDNGRFGYIDVSPKFISIAPNGEILPTNVPGRKLPIDKKTLPLILKAFNVDNLRDFINILKRNRI
jgi:hypothetical protein